MRKTTNNKTNFTLKLLANFAIPAILIFSAFALFIFFEQKSKLTEDADNQAKKSINWLISSIKIEDDNIIRNNNVANNTFKVFISDNKTLFDFNKNKIKVEVKDFDDYSSSFVSVENWSYRGDSIIQNASFLKPFALSLNCDFAIGQKTSSGYVVISSTLEDFELFLIPYSSKFIYTIENGEMYSDNILIKDIKYQFCASPLYINGKIQGFYANFTKIIFSKELTDLFLSNQFLKRGYPFAMDYSGLVLIHPNLQGTSISNTEFYKKIIQKAVPENIEKIQYKWPETSKGEPKVAFIKYIPELKIFIGSTYYLNDLNSNFKILALILFAAVIISSLIFSISILIISNNYKKTIEKINIYIQAFAAGIIPSINKKIIKNEELNSLYLLEENFYKLKDFTENLKEQNFTYYYETWSENDKIGENLKSLNTKLLEEQQKAKLKTEEQDKLIWLNEGLSKFIEILKYQVIEIHDLAYKITSQIVEYVGANEGGFFIVETDEDNEKYIELLSAYAMHKEKLFKRRIQFGEGLVGRVAIEKKMLFLTEIPDSYYKISTSLGEGKPKSIVLLPMHFNDEIIGVIELSSLHIFTELQLEFLERISENISANLAMWRASQQTAKLLQESQEQANIQQKQQKTLEKHLKELEKLRENSEQREIELNSIIKALDTTALLVEYDINGNILSANNRFLLTLERDASEVIGKNHKDITSMESNSREYIEFWKELLNGNTKRFIESFNVLENTIWLSQNYVPIIDKNNKVFKILNIAIDITENKTLERQLRSQVREISKEARTVRKEQRKVKTDREEFLAKEKSYLAIIKGVDKYIGHVEFNIDGKIMYVNDTFGKFLGFENASSLIDKNIKDLIYSKELETFKLAIENTKKEEEFSSQINFYNSKGNPQELKFSLLSALDTKDSIQKIIMIITIN